MEFGVLYDFRNPPVWQVPAADLYAQTLEHIDAVEAMGFDTVWLTEHHFTEDGYLPSPMTAAAAIAARTSRVTIGTSVMLLPLHHPLRVAEDAAVVDILSGGRLRLGFALGYVPEEFEAFGVERRHRPSLFEESVEVLRKAFSGEPIRHTGRHFSLPEAALTPQPVRAGGPEIWIGGRSEKPVRRAARIGDGALIDAPFLPTYQDELRAQGRTDGGQACVYSLTYPATDPERAMATCGPHALYRMAKYAQWYGEVGDLESDREIWRQAQAAGAGGLGDQADTSAVPSIPMFQTPDSYVEHLKNLEEQGATAVWWFATFPGLPPSATLPILRTIADEVIPQFR